MSNMQEIIFTTSNRGKVKTLSRHLDTKKYKITQNE
jgi:inosine/xanthosine triphosphate pyrophosphatase family protein